LAAATKKEVTPHSTKLTKKLFSSFLLLPIQNKSYYQNPQNTDSCQWNKKNIEPAKNILVNSTGMSFQTQIPK